MALRRAQHGDRVFAFPIEPVERALQRVMRALAGREHDIVQIHQSALGSPTEANGIVERDGAAIAGVKRELLQFLPRDAAIAAEIVDQVVPRLVVDADAMRGQTPGAARF